MGYFARSLLIRFTPPHFPFLAKSKEIGCIDNVCHFSAEHRFRPEETAVIACNITKERRNAARPSSRRDMRASAERARAAAGPQCTLSLHRLPTVK